MIPYSKTIIAASSWGILGFYRGLNDYDHRYEKYKNSIYKNKPYLYSERCFNGLLGFIFYISPPLLFFIIPNEIYRFEVNMRGMEYEKQSDKYNSLL
jgi:hypothetical protein